MLDRPARAQRPQMHGQQGELDGIRVIIIDQLALFQGQIGTVAIIIILREQDAPLVRQRGQNLFGDKTLA